MLTQLKASVDLGEDVRDRKSIHLHITLTLPTPPLGFKMTCTSTHVALSSGSPLYQGILYLYGV
jgi:hypothetical protein